MKRYFVFVFAVITIFSLTACGGNGDRKSKQDQLLIGTWVSTKPYVVSEQGMQITFTNMSTTYTEDHTGVGSGNLSLSGSGLPVKLKLSIATKSTWQIKNNQLIETITDADIKLKTKIPGLPDISKPIAEQMKSQKTSSEILKLDAQSLTLKESSTGLIVNLTKK